MNIDTINQKDSELNAAISKALQTIEYSMMDPFFYRVCNF